MNFCDTSALKNTYWNVYLSGRSTSRGETSTLTGQQKGNRSMSSYISFVSVVLVALALPSIAEAENLRLGWKKDKPLCLDFDYGDRFKSDDYDAHGANVTVIDCHNRENQDWSIDGKIISVNVQGQRYCLDFNRGDIVRQGSRPAHNVIGWSDCHGASIQQWTRDGRKLTMTWNGKTYCLDAVVGQAHKKLRDGRTAYNVTATTHCHGGAHQQWFVE